MSIEMQYIRHVSIKPLSCATISFFLLTKNATRCYAEISSLFYSIYNLIYRSKYLFP